MSAKTIARLIKSHNIALAKTEHSSTAPQPLSLNPKTADPLPVERQAEWEWYRANKGPPIPLEFQPMTCDEVVKTIKVKRASDVEDAVMQFARALRYNAQTRKVDDALKCLDKWIFNNKPLQKEDKCEIIEDLTGCFDKAEWPFGVDIAYFAYQRSFVDPVPSCANRWPSDSKLYRLVCMMAALHEIVNRDVEGDDKPFSLSVRQVGKIFSIVPSRANRWLKWMEKYGIIECVERQKPHPNGEKANTYLFVGAIR